MELRYCPTGDMMADALTKTAGAAVIQKLRDLCDGIFPQIPNETQCFRKADPTTWWGKGLEASFIKASTALRKTVGATCPTRSRGRASSTLPPSAPTAPPPASTSTPTTKEKTAEEKMAAALMLAAQAMLATSSSAPSV